MTRTLGESIRLFAPTATASFGAGVGSALALSVSAHEERVFDAGERMLRPLESVRSRSVYVVQSLSGDSSGSANDRLCALLFFIAALKDAGAACVSACIPYLAYARQDRRDEEGEPITSRYVAQLFEAVGTDRIVALEVHNPAALDNAFRRQTVHLDATSLFVRHFAADSAGRDYTVVSPDIGGAKRAQHFQRSLQTALGRAVQFALMDKRRTLGVLSGNLLSGDLHDRRVIVFDDLVSSGTTMMRAVRACRAAGASRVDVAATHGCFRPQASQLGGSDKPDSIVITDSVTGEAGRSAQLDRSLIVLPVAPCFAEAIRRLEQDCW